MYVCMYLLIYLFISIWLYFILFLLYLIEKVFKVKGLQSYLNLRHLHEGFSVLLSVHNIFIIILINLNSFYFNYKIKCKIF